MVELALPAALGMVILQLPFWRSLLAVMAYTIIFVAGMIAIGYYMGPQKRANPSTGANAGGQPHVVVQEHRPARIAQFWR
jgi:hypothetical protein